MTALRSGYSTGACAAAAAKGAALLLRDRTVADTAMIKLPTGASASFTLHSSHHTDTAATCSVIKDAGDDPDITNGAEVVATVRKIEQNLKDVLLIEGGVGIGRATKPGLAVLPGEWAINPVPRRMIEQAVREILPSGSYSVVISIPDGEERARKTLNARLGIIGGLSILGTTGIVRPISAKAWTDTIDTALNVARACGCRTVVLCTGRTSELAAMNYFEATHLPEEAFIMMGDQIAYALQSCHSHGFMQPLLACQFGKLLKIACGHADTHAAASDMDLSRLRQWAIAAGLPANLIPLISNANTAREVAIASGYDPRLMNLVCDKAATAIKAHAPSLLPTLLVCGYNGTVILSRPAKAMENSSNRLIAVL